MQTIVSVIIPFCNVSDLISDTIHSLQNQTFKDFEVILVNDGSTDDSLYIVEKLIDGDPRFKVYSQDNSGPAISRINGIKFSSGEFLLFLDADDFIDNQTIELMLAEALNRNLDVVIADYLTFDDKNKINTINSKFDTILMDTFGLQYNLAECKRIQNFIWGKLFRKAIVDIKDFDKDKIFGEDISTLYKIFERCKNGAYLCGKPLFFYRINNTSLSHRLNYRKLNNYCDALLEKTLFYKNNYPNIYKMTFFSNIDYFFLILMNYDCRRINNLQLLKEHIQNTCHGVKNRIKLFFASHPDLARLLLFRQKETCSTSKRKIAVINTYNRMSTGNVAKIICDGVSEQYETRLYYGRLRDKWDSESVYFGGSKFINFLNNIFVKLTGNIGGAHHLATKRLIKFLKKYNPDIIHLHNIHGNYLNYKILFNYLIDKRVVITMHDCFWLTGRCAHFINEKIVCDLWKSGCIKCPHKNLYMSTLFIDKAREGLILKNDFLSNCKHIRLVALSRWQMDLFVSNKVVLIPNGIDLDSIDCYQKKKNEKIVLVGVSQIWSKSKGIDDFNFLADNLDPCKYEIVLVGKKDNKTRMHPRIKHLGLLSNKETRKIICKANIFVNPTYIDTFPTVLIESLLSGTPIITYDVGGCRDIVGNCGVYVNRGDKQSLLKAIQNFVEPDIHSIIDRGLSFSSNNMVEKYKNLYLEVMNEK